MAAVAEAYGKKLLPRARRPRSASTPRKSRSASTRRSSRRSKSVQPTRRSLNKKRLNNGLNNDRLSTLFRMPQGRRKLLEGFISNGVNHLSVLKPNIGNHSIVKGLKLNLPTMGKKEFAVGYYNTAYGNGWRKATKADWKNPEFQAALVQAHQERDGWALLEKLLECRNYLAVEEGLVKIKNNYIMSSKQSFFTTSKIKDVYFAKLTPMDKLCNIILFNKLLKSKEDWDVSIDDNDISNNPPCLFYRIIPGGAAAP